MVGVCWLKCTPTFHEKTQKHVQKFGCKDFYSPTRWFRTFRLKLQSLSSPPPQNRHSSRRGASLMASTFSIIPGTAKTTARYFQVNSAKNSILFLELWHKKLNTPLESDKLNFLWELCPSETEKDVSEKDPGWGRAQRDSCVNREVALSGALWDSSGRG